MGDKTNLSLSLRVGRDAGVRMRWMERCRLLTKLASRRYLLRPLRSRTTHLGEGPWLLPRSRPELELAAPSFYFQDPSFVPSSLAAVAHFTGFIIYLIGPRAEYLTRTSYL